MQHNNIRNANSLQAALKKRPRGMLVQDWEWLVTEHYSDPEFWVTKFKLSTIVSLQIHFISLKMHIFFTYLDRNYHIRFFQLDFICCQFRSRVPEIQRIDLT